MTAFNLRNIKPETMMLLKQEAAQQKMSVNSLILQIIDKEFGMAHQIKKAVFNDLDYLAGTWSEEDQKIFDDNVKMFKEIDEEFWNEANFI